MAEETNKDAEDKIEIILPEEDKPVVTKEDKPVEKPGPEKETLPTAPEKPVDAEPEKPEYSAAVAGRIGNLTRKWRETERERDEFARVAETIKKENEALRKRAFTSDTAIASEAEGRVDAQIAATKREMLEAHSQGETEKFVDATSKLAALNAERDRVVSGKAQIKEERYVAAPSQPVQTGPSERAKDWAAENTWFGKDRAMTGAAYGIHEDLIKSGVSPESDEYYENLNTRMGEYFPTKFKKPESTSTVTPVRPDPVAASLVAPVSRSGGAPRQIRLTQSQVSVAKRLGVPLEVYAREYAKQLSATEGE